MFGGCALMLFFCIQIFSMTSSSSDAVVLLADGKIFKGKSFGAEGIATGEICFNTSMTGYQEVFTDPSYYGQILVFNNVHVGNYGISETEAESGNVQIHGLIARNLEEKFSRYAASETLKEYLLKHSIVAVCGIDTRALVTHIREKGAMNCIISSGDETIESLSKRLKNIPSMNGLDLADKVSTEVPYTVGNERAPYRIAVLDFGIKQNILNCLLKSDIYIKVFPAKTSFETLSAFNADGYFISNGPGDPSSMDYAVHTIQQILTTNKPFFGICLGHQLLALANGIPAFKMHLGHRGANHPVKNIITGKCEVTSQNHGFGIDADAVAAHPDVEATHVNINDGSIEGIRMKSKPAFSVQYHPESMPGPHDSRYLFDDFLALIKERKK